MTRETIWKIDHPTKDQLKNLANGCRHSKLPFHVEITLKGNHLPYDERSGVVKLESKDMASISAVDD